MGSNNFFRGKNRVSQVIFGVIILYALVSIACLWAAAGGVGLSDADRNYVLIAFSMLSFVVAVFICAYHLSTLFKRRKRKTDRTET
jgi:amino acid transporter